MSCAVCHRKAGGLGWFNPFIPRSNKNPNRHRYSYRWIFCSRKCQEVFSKIMNKTQGREFPRNEMEQRAVLGCLQPLGDYVALIGMQRPLADYSRDEIVGLISVTVNAYQQRMVQEHEELAKRDRAFFEGFFDDGVPAQDVPVFGGPQ